MPLSGVLPPRTVFVTPIVFIVTALVIITAFVSAAVVDVARSLADIVRFATGHGEHSERLDRGKGSGS